ncbi:MAG TPA: diguanylate cyclase [Burkholderiales bacterium]|nr:diguanylate cyclase [Burkholderiales bacterium]
MVVAIIASYTALDLAGRVSSASGKRMWYWLTGGAVGMGSGIWSMHFIGMLAFKLPIPIAFDLPTTLLSLAIAVLVSGFALYTLRRGELTTSTLTLSATLMGIGISAMHYTGMLAMRMSPPIHYTPILFVASVLIAIAASLAALWIALQLRQRTSGFAIVARLGSAVIMGFAITGMHYTGMAAAEFAPGSICLAAESGRAVDNSVLAVIVGIVTLVVLIGTLVVSSIDVQFAAHTAKLTESLQVANQELRTVALYDALTGLPNRILLEDRVHQAINRAARSGRLFALMFVDLDRFKPVNDDFGHPVGDLLLQQVGARLEAVTRKEDTVARMGGDEFIVLLTELTSRNEAAIGGQKLLNELNRPFRVESHDISVSGSIGVSIYPEDGHDIGALVSKADAAMYQVKREGRNGVTFSGVSAPLPARC